MAAITAAARSSRGRPVPESKEDQLRQSGDWGYQTAEGTNYGYDFHATVRHLLGIDHKRLVYC